LLLCGHRPAARESESHLLRCARPFERSESAGQIKTPLVSRPSPQ